MQSSSQLTRSELIDSDKQKGNLICQWTFDKKHIFHNHISKCLLLLDRHCKIQKKMTSLELFQIKNLWAVKFHAVNWKNKAPIWHNLEIRCNLANCPKNGFAFHWNFPCWIFCCCRTLFALINILKSKKGLLLCAIICLRIFIFSFSFCLFCMGSNMCFLYIG